MTTTGRLWTRAINTYTEHQVWEGLARTTIGLRTAQLGRLAREVGVPDPWRVSGPQLVSWATGYVDWSAETRRSHRTTLRGFYRWGVDQGHLDRSPALALPRVRPSAPNPRPVADAMFAAALMAADADERLMLRLAGDLGMRRGEVAQVHTRDVVEDLDGWSLLVHGKGGRERMVPMTRTIAREVRARPTGWVFPGDDGGHLSPRWIGTRVGRLLPDGWTMHKLRHRAGTRWYEQSAGDTFLVQELLGHADPKTTRIYVKVRGDRLRAVVEAAAA